MYTASLVNLRIHELYTTFWSHRNWRLIPLALFTSTWEGSVQYIICLLLKKPLSQFHLLQRYSVLLSNFLIDITFLKVGSSFCIEILALTWVFLHEKNHTTQCFFMKYAWRRNTRLKCTIKECSSAITYSFFHFWICNSIFYLLFL